MDNNEKIQRMIQPEELKKNKPLVWRTRKLRGVTIKVWGM